MILLAGIFFVLGVLSGFLGAMAGTTVADRRHKVRVSLPVLKNYDDGLTDVFAQND